MLWRGTHAKLINISFVRIAVSPQIVINIGGGNERAEESSPRPCVLQAPASSPTLVLHQGSGGVEFVREGCEENPTGAIASRLGEGGRQRTVVCKYAKWPASSVPAKSGGGAGAGEVNTLQQASAWAILKPETGGGGWRVGCVCVC